MNAEGNDEKMDCISDMYYQRKRECIGVLEIYTIFQAKSVLLMFSDYV